MAKNSSGIDPIPGQRVKQVITEQNITQKQFAKVIGIDQRTVSNIVRSKQRLTTHTAESIVKNYSDYRIEWLLGFSEYKTVQEDLEAFKAELKDAYHKGNVIFEYLLSFNDWKVQYLPTSNSDQRICYFKNKESEYFLLDEPYVHAFRGEIIDYVGLRMQSMLKTYKKLNESEAQIQAKLEIQTALNLLRKESEEQQNSNEESR